MIRQRVLAGLKRAVEKGSMLGRPGKSAELERRIQAQLRTGTKAFWEQQRSLASPVRCIELRPATGEDCVLPANNFFFFFFFFFF